MNFLRDEGSGLVELRQDFGQQTSGLHISLAFPEEIPTVEYLTTSHHQDGHRRLTAVGMDAENVEILAAYRRELAARADLVDLADQIPQPGRFLELESIGSLQHGLLELAH